MSDLHALRRELKHARLSLPHERHAAHSRAALRRLARLPQYRRASCVAGYFGVQGEIDPMPLLESAAAAGKAVYLPVLHPFRSGRLWFVRWRPGEPLRMNRFGIAEPMIRANRLRPARHLDLVIVPLLGFDATCRRLGMGGGYYDRSFAFTARHLRARRPFLVGLAGEHQQVTSLPRRAWDIVLDAVVTEARVYRR